MIETPLKNLKNWVTPFIILITFCTANVVANKEGYYGKYIGKLSQLHHGVSGDVFAVDARTLHLRNFNYDGEGPAAYFYAGNSKSPGSNGFRLRDERGTTNVLPKYRNKHITITLPEGKSLQNIKWFSVWCDEFSVNFGDVKIPKNLDFPKPQKISGLSGVHGVSSEPIVIVDAQTLLIPSFSYDGEAPDAKFWVGSGSKPSPQGIRIPDENGKEIPLRRYDRKTIVLTLPGELTIFDIGHFGVWCEAFTVDFGHIQIPRGLNIPPSLKMLGVSPQSKLNCEVLWDDFAYEVRWAVAGDSVVLQLVARLEDNEYMSFGLSGEKSRSRMVGGDVVVAWVDKENLKGYAEDYYLDAKSQCSGGRGSCPDEKIAEGAESVRLLNAALVNGYSIVTFQRSLRAQDEFDKNVLTNGSQPIIWAVGPLNSRKEVSYHSLTNRGDTFIDFGRAPKWNCPTPESVSDESQEDETDSKSKTTQITNKQESTKREPETNMQVPTPAPVAKSAAWEIPAIKCYEPEDGVFYAQMGPTGGKHGYSAITGHVGWGISWYINGLLIPEINVVRGRTYTFIVEGGLDPETPARYHPFYITDDPVGGYQYKTPEERLSIQIFAGAVQNKRGEVRPTGIGRLCNWTPDPNQPPADEFASFGAYQRTLRLECDPGNPGIIQWTVDKDTPDTVYYQCYTHRYLGWKINVHDHCERDSQASEPIPAVVKPPKHFDPAEYKGSESIHYEVKVKPGYEILQRGNQSRTQGNNFPTGVKYQSLHKEHHREEVKSKGEESIVKNQFGLKTIYADDRLKEYQAQPLAQAAVERPTQSFHSADNILEHQKEQQHYKVPLPPVQDDKSFSTLNRTPGLSTYSVTELVIEGKGQQNFRILPAAASVYIRPPSPENEFHSTSIGFVNHREKDDTDKRKPSFETFLVREPQIPNGGQIERDLHKNQKLLRIQAEEKLKKHNTKFDIRNNMPTSLRSGLGSLRKPFISSNGAFTLQQRPLPPGVFRPSHTAKPSKRPTSLALTQSGKIIRTQPYKYAHQAKAETGVPVNRHEGHHATYLLGAASLEKLGLKPSIPQNTQIYAQNTGFKPESVNVEGGFRPILNTPDVSEVIAIKRADVDIVNDDNVAADGNKQKSSSVDDSDRRPAVNPFKDLAPQMFEPIFVPSYPDNSVKKSQIRSKKKPLVNSRYNNGGGVGTVKKASVYIRMRPNFNLIRKPFYPENVMPPFKVPSRGFGPQFRNHLDPDEVEGESNATYENMLTVFNVTGEESSESNTTAPEEYKKKKLYFTTDMPLSYDGISVIRVEGALAVPGADSELELNKKSKHPQIVPNNDTLPSLNIKNPNGTKFTVHDIFSPGKKNVKKWQELTINNEDPPHKLQPTEIIETRRKRSPDHGPHHQDHQEHNDDELDQHDHDHDHRHHNHHNHQDEFNSNGCSPVKSNAILFSICGSFILIDRIRS